MNKKHFDAATSGTDYLTVEIAELKGWDVLDTPCSEKAEARAAQTVKLQAKHPIHVINVVWSLRPARTSGTYTSEFAAYPRFAIYRNTERVMGIVEGAIEHLRAKAVAAAEVLIRKEHAELTTRMEAVEWKLDGIAKRPKESDFKDASGKFLYRVYREADNVARAERAPFLTFFEKVKVEGVYSYGEDNIVLKPSQSCLDREIHFAVQSANYQFDAYLFKMIAKIGAASEAVLRDPEASYGLWGESFLHITLEDGTKQVWKTQQIVNRSVLGKYFYQWPTRLMK